MKSRWYPSAKKWLWGYDGGSYVGGPPRGVLHETQTTGIPSYRGGRTAPHLTLDKDGTFYQHIPFDRAARSLRNLSGGVQTNREGDVNIQIEVIAFSNKDDWTPAQVHALIKFFDWAKAEWGIPDDFPRSLEEPRMTFAEWLEFTGWIDHGGIPENIHWDVGTEAGVDEVFHDGEIPVILDPTMFVRFGDKGDEVEFWQRVMIQRSPHILPRWGADGQYGNETKTAIAALVRSSNGEQVGPEEAAKLLVR